ncbi:MAG: hypothetical protein FK731_11660 [Asgard group archaeon]|nr:hypothetical protein [Asgard group archaeon]
MKGKKSLLIISISIIVVAINVFQANLETTNAYENYYTMWFGDYVGIYHTTPIDATYKISWWFHSSNEQIGVKVSIMDQHEFYGFEITSGTLVSDGSYTEDSGEFTIPYEEIWYVVFFVTDIDSLISSTQVHVIVDFFIPTNTPTVERLGLPTILGMSIGIPVGLAAIIIPIIIFTVILPKKKKRSMEQDVESISSTKSTLIYCWKCGSENPFDKKFCGDCGTKLAKSDF